MKARTTMKPAPVRLSDLKGYGRLAIQATLGVTNLVEAMHHTILGLPAPLGKARRRPVLKAHEAVSSGLKLTSGAVYRSIRGITNLVGGGLDAALGQLPPELENIESGSEREAILSILNGVLGDYLSAHDNPLTLTMGWRHQGKPLQATRQALVQALPQPSSRILVLLHGHCMNELQWSRNGHHHGEVIASAQGLTPMYLRYNSGLHISTNGRALAEQLEKLVAAWPVPVTDLTVLGYSMGGLLARSAFHYGALAEHHWMERVGKLLFVGTPHHGSMVERAGNLLDVALEVSPYSRALSRLGKIRSAGTTDLRFGNLLDEDWTGRDRFAPGTDPRTPVPLPKRVQCYAIAALLTKDHGVLQDKWLGDGLVPVQSALGGHVDPQRTLNFSSSHQKVLYGLSHLGLLDSNQVCAQLQEWMDEPRYEAGSTKNSSLMGI
jgi:pimeloyl-ACP methyl ester carboxylesterase